MILHQAIEEMGQHTAEKTAILISRHTRLNYGMPDPVSMRNWRRILPPYLMGNIY